MSHNIAATVLVADDEPVIRDIVRSHLENEGYNVITSEDGQKAIKALKEHDISLAITDLKMPKVDGFGVVEYIKKHCGFIPIIVLTGYVDVELAVKAMKKGCFDYITKPIKRDELMEVVGEALCKITEERSQRHFKIAEIYLLRNDGAVVFHDKLASGSEMDSNIFGFMLTIIKTLVKDSSDSENGLKGLEHGAFKVLIEEGDGYFLTVIGLGNDMEPVKEIMKKTVKRINVGFGEIITGFDGNARETLEEFRDFETAFVCLKNMGMENQDKSEN